LVDEDRNDIEDAKSAKVGRWSEASNDVGAKRRRSEGATALRLLRATAPHDLGRSRNADCLDKS
jgi:hypothetical protein